MSASGKTTIGKKLFEQLQNSNQKWVFLDGDTFRNILGEDLGHTIEDRRKNAYRISRFCEYLNSQNINVLACVLSIFHDNQRYNKENIKDYKEVYIDVSFENLCKRDNKELYKKALEGEIKDVVGVDIEFKPPYSPDFILDNNIDNPDYTLMVQNILNEFAIKIDKSYTYTQEDLLQSPHKYQYSKFEGEEFFVKYTKDRQAALELFGKRVQNFEVEGISQSALKRKKYTDEKNLILKEFLVHLLEADTQTLKENESIISLLIKRFEVGKKLYLTYDLKEIRKSSTSYEELVNYPLFSLVLQKYYESTNSDEEKLIFFNAMLKVDDIISSIKHDIILPLDLQLAYKAISKELEISKVYL